MFYHKISMSIRDPWSGKGNENESDRSNAYRRPKHKVAFGRNRSGAENHSLPWPAPRTAGESGPSNNYGHPAKAWWGFASEGDRGRVEGFIGRLRRSWYLPKDAPTAAQIANEAEASLFRSGR